MITTPKWEKYSSKLKQHEKVTSILNFIHKEPHPKEVSLSQTDVVDEVETAQSAKNIPHAFTQLQALNVLDKLLACEVPGMGLQARGKSF